MGDCGTADEYVASTGHLIIDINILKAILHLARGGVFTTYEFVAKAQRLVVTCSGTSSGDRQIG
eukprot:4188469-Pleurochrysis_carterae.AAC.1